MHLAERAFDVAFRNGQVINPVERGHIAFRTDDLAAFAWPPDNLAPDLQLQLNRGDMPAEGPE